MKTLIIDQLKQQETYLLNLRESLEKRWLKACDSKAFQYERAKFIGMLDIAKKLDIDISPFNWVYNV